MKKIFARDAPIFGNHNADSIVSVFDLFLKTTGGSSKDPSESALMFLTHFGNDDFEELEYNRGLCRTVDGNFGFSPTVWSITLTYKIAYGSRPWDIEARYRTFKKNGRSNGSRLGRFYLNSISVVDNTETPNGAEEGFLRVEQRLYQIQNERELKIAEPEDETDAWSASMLAKGFVRGPQFCSYEELAVWSGSNSRPHVQSRSVAGYQVFFTD